MAPSTTVPTGIEVRLTVAPVSGTSEAADLLKIHAVAEVLGIPVRAERIEPVKKHGPKLLIALNGQPPVDLFEANAALRYLATHLPRATPPTALTTLRENSLYDVIERRIAAVIYGKRPDVNRIVHDADALLADLVDPSVAAAPDAFSGPELALFSDLYYLFRAIPSDIRTEAPRLAAWSERLGAHPSIRAAVQAAETHIEVVPVVLFQKASLANRRVGQVAKINECPSAPVLPQPGQRNVLITSALPYVNNIPHLGNIIGSTLSADVYARYSRARGHNTLYICGTDEYGTATETKALEEGVSCQALCDKYNAIHRQVYDWFGLSFDHFGRTTTPQQTEIAQDIFHKLNANGYTFEDTMTQLYCEHCSRFLADRYVEGTCPKCAYDDARGDQCDQCGTLLNAADLVNPRCKMDGNRPILRESTHVFLDLPKLQPQVDDFVARSSEAGQWTANGRIITQNWLREGLKPRCITRDLKWGTPVPLPHMTDKVFYVWYDAPIGYPSITANYTPEWAQWWKNPTEVKLYQFMGKDNVPFHTVIFPACELGTGDPWTTLHHINTTEYLNYEGGKFSKSRNVGVFGNNVMETGIPVEVWRYYLLASRPETSDSVFTWTDFIARNNNELLANVGNFVNRVMKFIGSAKYQCALPAWSSDLVEPTSSSGATTNEARLMADVNALLADYITTFDQVKLRGALQLAMAISQRGNGYLQESKLDNTLYAQHRVQCDTVVAVAVNLVYLLAALLYPFMPTTTHAICQQLNAPVRQIPDRFELVLQPGHVVGEADHLFKRIDEKMADVYRARYGGGSGAK
ncbi:methionine--tRNA ligase mes1 [Tieghemiomyces parasiticus]|uniref:methionine--tRNA ligase n=1 Tax=Tieghemiomyces parasiticus TaxID=78921 RepID=A0A9W8ABC5_9FUNG|nr:methionine--tRNA ligase mes1 [Tieghemiomyces parasiticus]